MVIHGGRDEIPTHGDDVRHQAENHEARHGAEGDIGRPIQPTEDNAGNSLAAVSGEKQAIAEGSGQLQEEKARNQ